MDDVYSAPEKANNLMLRSSVGKLLFSMMENLKNDSDSITNQSLMSLLNHNQLFDSDVANVRLSVNILGILLGTVGIVLNALLIASIVVLKSSNKIVGSSKMSRAMVLSLATADLLLLLVGNIIKTAINCGCNQ